MHAWVLSTCWDSLVILRSQKLIEIGVKNPPRPLLVESSFSPHEFGWPFQWKLDVRKPGIIGAPPFRQSYRRILFGAELEPSAAEAPASMASPHQYYPWSPPVFIHQVVIKSNTFFIKHASNWPPSNLGAVRSQHPILLIYGERYGTIYGIDMGIDMKHVPIQFDHQDALLFLRLLRLFVSQRTRTGTAGAGILWAEKMTKFSRNKWGFP